MLLPYLRIPIEIINIEDIYDLDPKIIEEDLFKSFNYKVVEGEKEIPQQQTSKKEQLSKLFSSLSGIFYCSNIKIRYWFKQRGPFIYD